MKLDYYLAKRPLLGHKESECGDIGLIKEFGQKKVFIALVDVLGHGKDAHRLASITKRYLQKNYSKSLMDIVNGLHAHIRSSSGEVLAVCLLDLKSGQLRYVGVGNIIVRKFGASAIRMVPRSGIVGYVLPTLREEIMQLCNDDVLVLCTDGVKSDFELRDYPELLKDSAKTIATQIIYQFGKEEDDAACIALRIMGVKPPK